MQTKLHLERGNRVTESLIIAETMQDVEDILERNKALRSLPQKSDWGKHVATIPNVLLVKWINEANSPTLRMYSKEFDELVAKKLNDPDYAYLRTDK